jgi:hypothetical protein
VTDAPRATGRHRAARRSWTDRLPSRPGGAVLKALAAGTAASGVAVALGTPAGPAGWAMALSESPSEQGNVAVAAPRAAAPQSQSFGLIGFTATAKPKPQPKPKPKPAPDPAAARATESASRSADYSRADLSGMSGMSDNAVAVVNEVHRAFPHLKDIGGYRAGDSGDHGTGHAVDVMCGTSDGDALAEHLQGMADTLNIKYIIWKQRIWYPGGGWEPMEDRGSATANHFDHVHVSVN